MSEFNPDLALFLTRGHKFTHVAPSSHILKSKVKVLFLIVVPKVITDDTRAIRFQIKARDTE